MSDNIKVVVKVRPLIARELEDKLFYQWTVKCNTIYQIDQNERDVGPCFTFDKVYDKDTKTCDVYNDIAKPIVEAATAGFNGTIFAYGQTSSGKTYTMTGSEDAPGIIPLAVINLFDIIKSIPNRDFLVRVSFVEIYNENLVDLLKLDNKIKIKDTLQGVKVDATEKVASSPDEVLDAMKEGKANRQTAATNMNEESSRSHSIFQITIESREHIEGDQEGGSVNVSQLNLVDLAGSERAGQTGATGLRFKEGTHINKSLSSLALVIKQLSEDPARHVNYRDSKLTRLLQNSLGGNAKTGIICAITPAAVEETISTLQFANRAKAIKNKPAVNAVATDATMIQRLTKQLSTLKTELEIKKSLEKDNQTLQKEIAKLQRLILNGFGQRSTAEILNPRKKLIQPRRITISTLQSIGEDSVSIAPKFCTPSLKYNPVILPGAPDFPPIQSAASLPTLPEEPRLITPPPSDRRVNFHDEIIELDSDEESNSDVVTCPTSPYHKCYESSKTPPCRLRENAKRAEKNLQDIVEMTGREKIYMPDVVEVMEKLDHSAMTIAKLEDDLGKLHSLSNEKEFEIEKLKIKISKAEEEIKLIKADKADLETRCKDYCTKLTDSEVSYETLKKKAKLREQELLSLLEEQKPKVSPEIIGKKSNQDTSIADSKNEGSLSELSDLQQIITTKDKRILDLEAIILDHDKTIASLKVMNNDYESHLNKYKEQQFNLEIDLSQSKTTSEALKKIVEAKKENIDCLKADIESYKNLVQELQIKLHQKDNTILNDSEIENLIASEQNFLANNENIKNLIHSLRTANQSQMEEIKSLKTSLHGNQTSEINVEKDSLLQEILQLKGQVDQNIITINNMVSEKNEWLLIKEQLNSKLNDLSETVTNLMKENESLLKKRQELETLNDELSKNVSERDDTLKIKSKKIEDLCLKINSLENEISLKDRIVTSFSETQEDSEKNFIKAKSAITKVQSILSNLTGNIQNIPDIIDTFVSLFNNLSSDLDTLDTVAKGIKEQNMELLDTIQQCEYEHALLEKKLDTIIDGFMESDASDELLCLIDTNLKNKEYLNIEAEPPLASKKSAYLELNRQIDRLSLVFETKQSYYSQEITSKNKEIEDIQRRMADKMSDMDANNKELLLIKEEYECQYQFLKQIFDKFGYLIQHFHIENTAPVLATTEAKLPEMILIMLDKIENHMKYLDQSVTNNLDIELNKTKKEIQVLAEQNLKLMNDISHMETKHSDLYEELIKIKEENKYLAKDLDNSGKVLKELKHQLESKVKEMEILESKARQCKLQFVNLDFLIKEQMYALQLENINLKSRNSDLRVDDQYDNEHCDVYSNDASSDYKTSNTSVKCDNLKCPPSLLTLCCNKMTDFIQVPNNSTYQVSSSSSNTRVSEVLCRCDKVDQLKLQDLKEENMKLQSIIDDLVFKNKQMFREHNEVQKEVNLLLDLTFDLQKKVINHRTNLSTLTATTYAENKSLSSQIKFLQHHHSRFHNVCQRDIPPLKKQLEELLTLLKSDNYTSNDSYQRYLLPSAFEVSSALANFKNDSTLDSELLMLDTNVTLTTTGDTTMVGHDHTCLDVTQVCMRNEVACQTISTAPVTHCTLLNSQIVSPNDKVIEKVEELKKENSKLREMVNDYLAKKEQSSDIVGVRTNFTEEEHRGSPVDYLNEIEVLNQKLLDLESEKHDIFEKYENLLLEVPSRDALVKKIVTLETELTEFSKIKDSLSKKNKEMANLQDENDSLSTQLMEVISENDHIKKDLDKLKITKTQLSEKCLQLQIEVETLQSEYQNDKIVYCQDCDSKNLNKVISSLEEKISSESHAKISRSYSDSDRTSRYNTICTLQSELHAGKEDCNKLKEEVTTIKNHLDRSNLSMGQAMDMDDSIVESNIYSDTKDLESVESKCNIANNTDDHSLQLYSLDKADCFKYYAEITGIDNEEIRCDIKIIDVMKMFYNNILIKHGNEVENLVNKLRDYEDSKIQLQSQLQNITQQYSCTLKELKEKSDEIEAIKVFMAVIRKNITHTLSQEIDNSNDILCNFKNTVLNLFDTQFELKSTLLFDSILRKFTDDLQEKTNQCSKLEQILKNIQVEFSSLNDTVMGLKTQLTEKENECNLLKIQKDKIQEINTVVTLDIVNKKNEFEKLITEGCRKLLEHNILVQGDIEKILPLSKNIDTVFKLVIDRYEDKYISEKEEHNQLILKITSLKDAIDAKDIELDKLMQALHENRNDLLAQKNLFDDINEIYSKKVQENETNLSIINKLNVEINGFRQSLITNEKTIKMLQDDLNTKKQDKNLEDKIKELISNKENLEQELVNLKLVNQKIVKENDCYVKQVEESSVTIKNNKVELEALTSEILMLKESVKENINIIENLKQEMKLLFDQNSQVNIELQERAKECSRLQMNIKTHEKTAEIQSKMIIRLQKQKEEDAQLKNKEIEELNKKCASLQNECDVLNNDIKICGAEVNDLKSIKESLEAQLSEAREAGKPRPLADAMNESSRRRRQSIVDCHRLFASEQMDTDDHKTGTAVGAHTKSDDCHMDVDGNDSNRSTPLRRSKGRESSQCKHDQEEDGGSRPSSVLAARRRRQSVHDLPRKLQDHQEFEKPDADHGDSESCAAGAACRWWREALALRERCRELDEECDTCAEYLRERDAQCARLKREKHALEQSLIELKTQVADPSLSRSGRRSSFSDAAVNTDEDWANLHSVVVDRMSYDAVVEKNKKLTKSIEELRFQKQDLKTTIAKMQKALEKKSSHSNKELEAVKCELRSCRAELAESRERCRELDEECETCAEYLKEREERCRKLKEAKCMLEAKLKEYEEDSNAKMLSVRKKRQSMHDQNRLSTSAELQDAATETNDDFLCHQVEKDSAKQTPDEEQVKELTRLRCLVERLSQQKGALEQQLLAAAAQAHAYVATGSAIVQNQQLTDVMKENQKLKRMNAKLVHICKKRGKSLGECNQSNRENQDPAENV